MDDEAKARMVARALDDRAEWRGRYCSKTQRSVAYVYDPTVQCSDCKQFNTYKCPGCDERDCATFSCWY